VHVLLFAQKVRYVCTTAYLQHSNKMNGHMVKLPMQSKTMQQGIIRKLWRL